IIIYCLTIIVLMIKWAMAMISRMSFSLALILTVLIIGYGSIFMFDGGAQRSMKYYQSVVEPLSAIADVERSSVDDSIGLRMTLYSNSIKGVTETTFLGIGA